MLGRHARPPRRGLRRAGADPADHDHLADPERLREEIEVVRANGWAMVDQELEIGLRSIAAPLRAGGRTIAALNVAVAAGRVSAQELREAMLPELLRTAERISSALGASRRNGRLPAAPAG